MRTTCIKNITGKLLAPRPEEFIDLFPPLVRHEFKIKDRKKISFSQVLGWITVQHGDVIVAAHAPDGVEVSIRPSLI